MWSTFAPSKYVPSAHFGMTGMFCPMFDFTFRCIRLSDQPNIRPAGMLSVVYQWKLVDDFVKAFNLHRRENFISGTFICTDEIISRWYGGGGYWINEGLPCYIDIYHKPKNGRDIQNSACGESGVMLRLKLVKNIQEEVKADLGQESGNGDDLIHGCKVPKEHPVRINLRPVVGIHLSLQPQGVITPPVVVINLSTGVVIHLGCFWLIYGEFHPYRRFLRFNRRNLTLSDSCVRGPV